MDLKVSIPEETQDRIMALVLIMFVVGAVVTMAMYAMKTPMPDPTRTLIDARQIVIIDSSQGTKQVDPYNVQMVYKTNYDDIMYIFQTPDAIYYIKLRYMNDVQVINGVTYIQIKDGYVPFEITPGEVTYIQDLDEDGT